MDLDLTMDGKALYLIDRTSQITKVNPDTFAIIGRQRIRPEGDYQQFPYDIRSGLSNIVYYVDTRKVPAIHVFDFERGQELGIYDLGGEGVGNVAISKTGTNLFTWRQDGWVGEGTIYSWLARVDCTTTKLTRLQISPPVAQRYPFDTPVLLTANEERVFNKRHVFSSTNLDQVLATFGEDIYAITLNGDVAVGSTHVFNGRTAAVLGEFPFESSTLIVTRNQKSVALFRESTRELVLLPLAQFLKVSSPGLTPTPKDSEPVTSELGQLEWSSTPPAVAYQIYFGTNRSTVVNASTTSAEFVGVTENTSIKIPQKLSGAQFYYWRVDVVTLVETNRGPVWSFQVPAAFVSPARLTVNSALGHSPAPIGFRIVSEAPGAQWQITQTAPWYKVSPASGTASAVLQLSLDTAALAEGRYTNSFRFSTTDFILDVPVELQVFVCPSRKCWRMSKGLTFMLCRNPGRPAIKPSCFSSIHNPTMWKR